MENSNSLDKISESLANRNEFYSWILRAYFQDTSKPWYTENTTQETVGKAMTHPKFPATAQMLLEIWQASVYLKQKFTSLKFRELDEIRDYLDKVKQAEEAVHDMNKRKGFRVPYAKGEVTLLEISDKLDNSTAAMINKISMRALHKMKEIMSLFDTQNEFEDKLNFLSEKIAMQFATLLKKTSTVAEFVELLARNHILTEREMELVSAQEIEALTIFKSEYEIERIALILQEDLWEEDNMFKTFQNACSFTFWPVLFNRAAKRKKNIEHTVEGIWKSND